MSCSKQFGHRRFVTTAFRLKGVGLLMLLAPLTVMSLTACSDQNRSAGKNASKILVKVNGDGITAQQLDAELLSARGTPEESPAALQAMRKQALEALIDRKILLGEALHNKIDRDPKVIQVIERFKTQAIVQAYLESQAAVKDAPSKDKIDDYFQTHPELFAHRKVLDINQLSIASEDFSGQLKTMMDSAKSLNQVQVWLDAQKIAYVKTAPSYTSADMPSEVIDKLQHLGRNHLFILKDGQQDQGRDQVLLCALTELRDSPVSAAAATAQIERYLINKKMQEVAAAEIARLRPLAKLDYVDKSPEALPDIQVTTVPRKNGGRIVADLK